MCDCEERLRALLTALEVENMEDLMGEPPEVFAVIGRAIAVAGEKHLELLDAVESKRPGESRHEAALRYIRRGECQDTEAACGRTST